jgi:hypothetical protein
MSIKGVVEVRCPKGCEAEEIEVWSFVRGDQDAELRETLLVGELNLVLCAKCGSAFYADATVIYLDEEAQLLAFIFPESYKADEARWRAKMAEDFSQLKAAMPGLRLEEPRLFFGFDEIRELLRVDDEMSDEVEVARAFMKQLGLASWTMDRAFARARRLPWDVPLIKGKPFSRENALQGLKTLLKANDRLEAYRRLAELLEAATEQPPAAGLAARKAKK